MNLNCYELNSSHAKTVFEFTSEGPKGHIHKIIRFKETSFWGFYNLGFGDKCDETFEMDDTTVSNNGDKLKILETVAAAIYEYTDVYPEHWILAKGNTPARNRLYRMGISKHLRDAVRDFEILGLKDGAWKCFERNMDYEAFIGRRKIKN